MQNLIYHYHCYSEVHTVVNIKAAVFWYMTLCSLVDSYHYSWETYFYLAEDEALIFIMFYMIGNLTNFTL